MDTYTTHYPLLRSSCKLVAEESVQPEMIIGRGGGGGGGGGGVGVVGVGWGVGVAVPHTTQHGVNHLGKNLRRSHETEDKCY